MTTHCGTPEGTLLTPEDLYYLELTVVLSPKGDPDDPQAQRVYAVQDAIIDMESPVWTLDEVKTEVDRLGQEFGLRIKVVTRDQPHHLAYAGRGGGTIVLPSGRAGSMYNPLVKGRYLGSLVYHECAHVLTPHAYGRRARYPSEAFQSHGPEFVSCFLHILGRITSRKRALEAFRHLGVVTAPHPMHRLG